MLRYWKRRNDEMGKAAHVGVGRLIPLGDLDGVQGEMKGREIC